MAIGNQLGSVQHHPESTIASICSLPILKWQMVAVLIFKSPQDYDDYSRKSLFAPGCA